MKELKLGDANLNADILFYSSDEKTDKSLVLVPPTGGTNYIDRRYAKLFCSAGYDVYVLNHWTGEFAEGSDLTLHQKYYDLTQKSLNLIFDYIKTPFIGMLGTSLGGLHASISANTQPKLNAVFVIVAGTPLSEIIVNSSQQAMVDLRAIRKDRFGFKSGSENIQAIDQVFHFEPASLGDGYKKKDLGMVLTKSDTVVPSENQIKLKEYWQPKVVIELDSSHFWAIVKAWLFHSDEIITFFEDSYGRRLAQK